MDQPPQRNINDINADEARLEQELREDRAKLDAIHAKLAGGTSSGPGKFSRGISKTREIAGEIADTAANSIGRAIPSTGRGKAILAGGLLAVGGGAYGTERYLDNKSNHQDDPHMVAFKKGETDGLLKFTNDPVYQMELKMGVGDGHSDPYYEIADAKSINFSAKDYKTRTKNAATTSFDNYHDYLTYRKSLTPEQLAFIETIGWTPEKNAVDPTSWQGEIIHIDTKLKKRLNDQKDSLHVFQARFDTVMAKALRGEYQDTYVSAKLELAKKGTATKTKAAAPAPTNTKLGNPDTAGSGKKAPAASQGQSGAAPKPQVAPAENKPSVTKQEKIDSAAVVAKYAKDHNMSLAEAAKACVVANLIPAPAPAKKAPETKPAPKTVTTPPATKAPAPKVTSAPKTAQAPVVKDTTSKKVAVEKKDTVPTPKPAPVALPDTAKTVAAPAPAPKVEKPPVKKDEGHTVNDGYGNPNLVMGTKDPKAETGGTVNDGYGSPLTPEQRAIVSQLHLSNLQHVYAKNKGDWQDAWSIAETGSIEKILGMKPVDGEEVLSPIIRYMIILHSATDLKPMPSEKVETYERRALEFAVEKNLIANIERQILALK